MYKWVKININMIFYSLGWVALFLSILLVVHKLSFHIRAIVVWLIKISIALYITCVLGLMVFISENIDLVALNDMAERLAEKVYSIRMEGL